MRFYQWMSDPNGSVSALIIFQTGSGADTIVGAIRTKSSPQRYGPGCHDVTPAHRGIGRPCDRNCEPAFVNLLRQFDTDNDASRIVERLESRHRLQAPLHPAVALLHNVCSGFDNNEY